MDEPLIAPKEIQNHEGSSSSSSMTVQMTDVLGRPFRGPVRIGRYVQLVATSDGAGKEWGIRPDGCNIVGMNTGTSYAILRAGCGDGLVFGKDKGFSTVNLTSTSPPFKLISVIKDSLIKFSCNFTLCTKLCNENSCSVERKRRDVTPDQIVIVSHAIPILDSIAIVSTPYIDTTTPGPLNKDSQYSITVPPLVIESSGIHKSNTSLYNAQKSAAIETDAKPLLSARVHQLKTTSYNATKTVPNDPNAKPLSSHVLHIDDHVKSKSGVAYVNKSLFRGASSQNGSNTKPKNLTSAYSIDKYFSLSERSKHVLSEGSLSQPSYPMLARLPLGGYAFDLQSAWPLWVGVLLAIAMCSTLILAAVFLNRRRSDGRSDDIDNHDEYDSLLKE